jgi:hypothetical protein
MPIEGITGDHRELLQRAILSVVRLVNINACGWKRFTAVDRYTKLRKYLQRKVDMNFVVLVKC